MKNSISQKYKVIALFCKRTGTVGVSYIKWNLQRSVAGCRSNYFQQYLQDWFFFSWVRSHAVDLSSPYLNKLFGSFWGIYHPLADLKGKHQGAIRDCRRGRLGSTWRNRGKPRDSGLSMCTCLCVSNTMEVGCENLVVDQDDVCMIYWLYDELVRSCNFKQYHSVWISHRRFWNIIVTAFTGEAQKSPKRKKDGKV